MDPLSSPARQPGGARGTALALQALAVLGVGAAVWAGQRFLAPLVAGLLLALLAAPVVARLQRVLRSELAAVAGVLLAFALALAAAAWLLGDPILRVLDRVPEMIRVAARDLASGSVDGTASPLARMREALGELETVAAPDHVQAVRVAPDPATVLRDTAFVGSGLALRAAGDLAFAFFTAFFVLAGGRTLAQRFLDLWGESGRRRAACVLAEAARQTRLYVGVLLVTNVVLGVMVWAAFHAAGLPDPAGWAVTAAVLHVVPYVGMAVMSALAAAQAWVTHGSAGSALGMAAGIVVAATLVGTFMTAWLQSRASRMSAALLFIGLMFWGAMWGLWGLLLGPALVVLTKVALEQVPGAEAWARLLAGADAPPRGQPAPCVEPRDVVAPGPGSSPSPEPATLTTARSST
ncbi:MAG: AI-2E family transporter [Rubrivivax sp.]|nr:AI-2E family transporter [Rubrivivax sp.]